MRTGRLWAKAPAKAKVSVTVGKTPGGGLNGSALCDFAAEVTVDGETLSEEELRILAESRDGLVRIRGEWVMADPEKIQELLAHWKEAKRLVGDGVTMAQALRLLAGGGLDSLAGRSDADDAVEVRANGELKDLLESLSHPKADAAKFTPDLRVGAIHPSDMSWREFSASNTPTESSLKDYVSRYDLVLTTYGQFTRLKELAKLPFHAVIADEAQAIKNPGSGQSKAVRSVASPRRLALTGTPVENRLTDLWSIFDFVNPGLLGSLAAFRKATDKSGDYSVVRRLTRPFVLRRLKTDKSIISDLPDKTELDVSTALSRKQTLLYARTVEELRKALDETTGEGSTIKRKGLILAYMLKFKQICDHPALYLGTDAYRPEDSGKFLVLGERAAEVASRQEKMLVFTQYREMCEPLADFLATVFGREGLILHGGTPVATRGNLVKRFQDPAGPPISSFRSRPQERV